MYSDIQVSSVMSSLHHFQVERPKVGVKRCGQKWRRRERPEGDSVFSSLSVEGSGGRTHLVIKSR